MLGRQAGYYSLPSPLPTTQRNPSGNFQPNAFSLGHRIAWCARSSIVATIDRQPYLASSDPYTPFKRVTRVVFHSFFTFIV